MSDKLKHLIPGAGSDGFLRNISELVEEYKSGNIQCFCLTYKRKHDGSMRTYFINRDDPYMLSVLIRLMLDLAQQYHPSADYEEF